MPIVRKFGEGKKAQKQRPSGIILGIGGAGRNIINDIKNKQLLNFEKFEVGSSDRPFKLNSLKISTEDMQTAFESNVSLKSRPMTNSEKKIKDKIKDTDIVYIISGLGGNTGSFSTPVCGEIAKIFNVMSVGLLAKPFKKESKPRRRLANKAQNKARSTIDLLIPFSNEKLFDINPQLPITKAFSVMNNLIKIPLVDFNRVLTREDIQELKMICEDVSQFRLGSGYGTGRNFEERSVNEALRSPWLKEFNENKKMIVFVTKQKGVKKESVEQVLDILSEKYPEVDIIWGSAEDKNLKKKIRTTILVGK